MSRACAASTKAGTRCRNVGSVHKGNGLRCPQHLDAPRWVSPETGWTGKGRPPCGAKGCRSVIDSTGVCGNGHVLEPQKATDKDSTGLPWAIEEFTLELSPATVERVEHELSRSACAPCREGRHAECLDDWCGCPILARSHQEAKMARRMGRPEPPESQGPDLNGGGVEFPPRADAPPRSNLANGGES